jgi:MraZ protein
MLRGNIPAKLDPKGRLKIPSNFLKLIEDNFGSRLFVTSLDGHCVRIYPLPVWEEIEEKLAAPPTTQKAKLKFMDLTNFYGQEAEIDDQGRVLIHMRLREAAKIDGDLYVMGHIRYLEIWPDATFRAEKIDGQSLTPEDLDELAELGI